MGNVYIYPLVTMLINLLLAIYVLTNNPKATLNRIYFCVTMSLVVWCFGDVMFFLSHDLQQALIWDRLTSISSIFTVAFLLHFFVVFSHKFKIRISYIATIYVLPFIFTFISIWTKFISGSVKISEDGFNTTVPGPLYVPFTGTVAVYVVIGIIICFRKFLQAKLSIEKKQAMLIIVAESIPLIGGIILEIIPSFYGYEMLPLTSTLSTGSAIIVGYAMLRYGLMVITPEMAAENIIQTMDDYLIVVDNEKKIRLVNQSCLHALGYEKEELEGRSYTDIFVTDGLLNELAQRKQVEMTIQTKDGTSFPVMAKGSTLKALYSGDHGYVLVLRDLREINTLVKNLEETKQKLQNINTDLESKVNERTKELVHLKDNLEQMVEERTKQIKISEKRFSQLAEDAGEWIWEVDENGLYTYSNAVIQQVLGYSPDEIVGKKYFYELFPADKREQMKNAIMKDLSQHKKFTRYPNMNVHKNGSIVYMETNASPVFDEAGNFLGYRGADMDVTKRKIAEEELKKRADELEQMNKLMVGRELKMAELKKELTSIREQHPDNA